MATVQSELDRMPSDLKERGWKIERKIVNDDEENPEYIARNPELGLTTDGFPVPATAIAAARKIDGHHPPRSEGPIVKPVSLLQIRTDGGTQPRAELDHATVDRFAEDMSAGQYPKFPPVVVFHDGSTHWLADGFHRFFAYKKAFGDAPAPGMNSWAMTAEVRQGTQRDAVLYSLGANAAHGLPRSNADKRRAVQTLLNDPEWSAWSDNVIAHKANVSQPFVSSLRRELSQNVLSDGLVHAAGAVLEGPAPSEEHVVAPAVDRPGQIETPAPPTPTKRVGRDGVARETKNIGRTARAIPAEVDIEVPDAKITTGAASKPAAKPDPEGWSNEPLNLHIQINAGKTAARGILVGGRHGDGKPLFRNFTFAELEPLPPAIMGIFEDLKKAYRKAKPQLEPPTKKKPTARKK